MVTGWSSFSRAAGSPGDPPGYHPSPCSLSGKQGHKEGLGDRQDQAWLKELCWVKPLWGWG